MTPVFAENNNNAPCYHVFVEVEAVNEHATLSEDQKRKVCRKSPAPNRYKWFLKMMIMIDVY